MKRRLALTIVILTLLGCGGHGLKRGISAACMDGQYDFATSCGALCFGHNGVSEYLQGCD
jgi:hypothetical protein